MHFPRSKDGAAPRLHFTSIPCPGQGEKQCPGCQKGGCIPEFLQCLSFSRSGSAWLVTWGSRSHDVILKGVWLPSLYPFWENKSQPGSTSPSVEVGWASSTTNSPRTGLEVADGVAVPLLQWSVALHTDGECDYRVAVFHRNTFLSLPLLFSFAANCKESETWKISWAILVSRMPFSNFACRVYF